MSLKNLWVDTAGTWQPNSALTEDIHADIAIVGAGVMGAIAALRLAESGRNVVLLEAGTVGEGATSKPGGFIVPHFSVGSPQDITRRLGETGAAFVRAVGQSAQRVFDIVRDLGIDCDAKQGGWYHPAHSPATFRALETTAVHWQDAGLELDVLTGAQTEQRTGVSGYFGSWHAPSGGTLHPLKYCRGLVSAARSAGCRVFENSPVETLLTPSPGFHVVKTQSGTVKADKVLICTNAFSKGLVPALEESVFPLKVWQCATRPLAPEERTALFQNGESLSDTQRNLFTYRFDNSWRLITGALDAFGRSPDAIAKGMGRRLQKALKVSAPLSVDYLWTGTSAVSGARLPATLVANAGVYAATSCNGRGLALSTIVGEALADMAMGNTGLPIPTLSNEGAGNARLQGMLSRFYPHLAPVLDWLDAGGHAHAPH